MQFHGLCVPTNGFCRDQKFVVVFFLLSLSVLPSTVFTFYCCFHDKWLSYLRLRVHINSQCEYVYALCAHNKRGSRSRPSSLRCPLLAHKSEARQFLHIFICGSQYILRDRMKANAPVAINAKTMPGTNAFANDYFRFCVRRNEEINSDGRK